VFNIKQATEPAEPTVALSTYMRLAQSRPQPLPSLVRLHIEAPCALLEQWPLFASYNLAHLEMAGIKLDHAHIIDPFMSTLASLAPVLMESLVLSGQFAWSNALGSFVQFRCLHSLMISDPISAETLRGFGSLPGLNRFDVILTNSDVPCDVGFPTLETLKIKGTPSVLQSVLDNISTPCLLDLRLTIEVVCVQIQKPVPVTSKMQSLNGKVGRSSKSGSGEVQVEVVTAYRYPPDEWWKRWFATLNSRWSYTLNSISISLDRCGTGQSQIPLGLFSGLDPFMKLIRLDFKNSRFSPTADEIRDLASVCPGIKELRLSVADCIPRQELTVNPGGRKVPVGALQALAEKCPELSFLSIGLDIDSLPPFLPDKVYSHRLRWICVGSAPETRTTASLLKTARHIHRLFPYLEGVQTCPDNSAGDWKQIGEMISAYQDICLDEISRCGTRVIVN